MKIRWAILIVLMFGSLVQAAGLTIWGLTEQMTSVNSDNAIVGRVGYDLSVGNGGGLEPFIGSVWRPRDEAPQVITLGAIQHMPDLIDPNNPIPYLE